MSEKNLRKHLIATGWVRVGSVHVDSGSVWLGDPCYVLRRGEMVDDSGLDYNTLLDLSDALESPLGIMPINHKNQLELEKGGKGIWCRDFGGDGSYDVYALRERAEGGFTRALTIVFWEEDEEDTKG